MDGKVKRIVIGGKEIKHTCTTNDVKPIDAGYTLEGLKEWTGVFKDHLCGQPNCNNPDKCTYPKCNKK